MNQQKGRTMIEMLGVLAIIAVLSVISFVGYSKAITMYRTNKTIDLIAQLVANIRTLYWDTWKYSGLDNEHVLELGVAPKDLLTMVSGELRTPFRGNVYVNPTSASADDPMDAENAFEVTVEGLPREACLTIATSDWGSGSQAGLVSIRFSAQKTNATSTSASTNSSESRKIGCGGRIATAANGAGEAIACPDGDYRSPLSVSDASKACNCVGVFASKCSVSWIYF